MVYRAFHRSVTTGVVLAGASVITFSSVAALPADEARAQARVVETIQTAPPVVTADVELLSLLGSLELLGAGALAAVEESIGTFSGEIPALWNQVGWGIPGAQWEDPNLLPYNYSLLADILFAPIAPLVVGPFTDAVTEVLAQTFPSHGDEIRERLPEAVDYAFARLVGPVVSAIGAFGVAHRAIYDAGMAGNPPGQWLGILSAPAHMLDGFLFGGYGDISPLITGEVGGERIAAPGLLTPWGQFPEDRSVIDEEDDEDTGEEAGEQTETGPQSALPNQVAALGVEERLADEAETDVADEDAEPAEAGEETGVIEEAVEEAVEEAGDSEPAGETVSDETVDETVSDEADEDESALAGLDESADDADNADTDAEGSDSDATDPGGAEDSEGDGDSAGSTESDGPKKVKGSNSGDSDAE